MKESKNDEFHTLLQGGIEAVIKKQYEDIQVDVLTGDASLRRYYRLRPKNYGGSYVLMLADPFIAKNNTFLQVQHVLDDSQVAVPKVYAYDAVKGAILLEDLSDRTVLHLLGEVKTKAEQREVYKKAIDLLVEFHEGINVELQDKKIPGFSLAFDEEKLMWEINFTIEHLLQKYLKRNLEEGDLQEIRAQFLKISKRLAAEPRVFTHRDYHSRNIMVPETNRYTCIDFQDARMGLRQYDLASLLRDSYFQLPDEDVYELVDYYLAMIHKKTGVALNKTNFVQIFDLMSIQRNFKAIGSFASFYVQRGDAHYLRFVGNTFEAVRANLQKFSEYHTLLKLLYRYYYF